MSRPERLILQLARPTPASGAALLQPSPTPPAPSCREALAAQEAAEDERLLITARDIWRAAHEYSCPEDNETTPWIQYTKAPILF
jgi:hypothetical protein